jgi:hypothetical protein
VQKFHPPGIMLGWQSIDILFEHYGGLWYAENPKAADFVQIHVF